MKHRHLHIFITLLLFIGLGNLALAQTFTVGDLNYSLNYDATAAELTGHVNGSAATGQLVIPDEVEYNGTMYPVETIGLDAFNGCIGLTGTLVIPNSVKSIAAQAFMDCPGFTDLTLGNSVRVIGMSAFDGCSNLTGALILPPSLASLGNWAFFECSGFDELWIQSLVTDISMGCFMYCTGLTQAYIGGSIETIEEDAFYGCSALEELTIGPSVTEIGNGAFANCININDFDIKAANPPTIEGDSFFNVPPITVSVPYASAPAYSSSSWSESFTFHEMEYLWYDKLEYWVNGLSELQVCGHVDQEYAQGSITIPAVVNHQGVEYPVTIINSFAFYEDNLLDGELVLGENLKEIRASAFKYCNFSNSKLVIPNSVEEIGMNAFKNMGSLGDTLVLGTGIMSVGEEAFDGTGIHVVKILKEDAVPNVNYDAFNYNSTAIVPCGKLDMYLAAGDGWNRYFDETIEDCVAVETVEENLSSIYPNPTHGILKIEAENLRSVSIFNALGQQVFNSEASGDSFEYRFNDATGMYLIRVETSKGVETKRVIVM